jgi:hypothetical protein
MISSFYNIQACTSPIYPNPNPDNTGPNNRIHVIFQHLFFDRAIVPVKQIKQSIDSKGYRIARIYTAPRICVKQGPLG